MATLNNNSRGFGLIEILLLVIAISGVIGVGYYIFSQNSNKTNSPNSLNQNTQSDTEATSVSNTDSAKSKLKMEPYKEVISFKDNGSLTETQKNEISLKLAEPLSFYHFKNLNIPLKEVTIQKAETQGYTLSYVYVEKPETNKFGFVFNASEIRYWQPMLCDQGGCIPYPESLKEAYPANYKAYEACQAAEGDKEKQSTIGCDYAN